MFEYVFSRQVPWKYKEQAIHSTEVECPVFRHSALCRQSRVPGGGVPGQEQALSGARDCPAVAYLRRGHGPVPVPVSHHQNRESILSQPCTAHAFGHKGELI